MLSPRSRFLLLLMVMILTLTVGCSNQQDMTRPSPNVPVTWDKAAPAGYYDTVDTSTPAAMRSSLHAIIDDGIKIPYTATSTDTWDVEEAACEDPNNPNQILDVYKNASYPKYGGGNTDYNREHVWAKSYGFPNDGSTNYPYTDCHHLFLCDSGYNSARSNKPFRNADASATEEPTIFNNGVGGGTGVYPGNSNWTSGSFTQGTWEVWNDRRGDIARALFYMDVRYEGGVHPGTSNPEPDLILTDDEALIEASNTGANESVAYMGMLSVLLQWNQEDPVDAKEMMHNDVVYSYQGNRNPFIDHPEWVDCVFGSTCGGGDTTPPAAPTGLVATPGNGSVSLDWADNGEPDLAGYTVYRAAVSGGPYNAVNGSLLTVSNYTDSGLVNGTTYYYVVTASDNSANESGNSTEASATPAGSGGGGGPASAWINEFHYDNSGTDTGEFFEIAGTAGLDLAGWTVQGYNGNGGTVYSTVSLSGVLPDQQSGFGTLAFNMAGMQNGSPDGLALVDDAGSVIQFISYEGVVSATAGPAAGTSSTDVGVAETSSTPVGYSLQLAGSGSAYADFTWQAPQNGTSGAVNTGQSFIGGTPNQAPTAVANGPYTGEKGVAVSFSSAGSSDSDGTIVSYAWDFGDGGTSTAVNPTHTYTATGTYNVSLTVTDDGGATGNDATIATISDTTAPAVPTALAATAGDGSVALDWADNGEADLAGYTVKRATTSGGPYTALNGTLLTVSNYTDTGVVNGTTYYYVVTASDNAANESAASGEVSALPAASGGGNATVWINELHYDNDGTDTGEFFEIAGPAGTDLTGWSVIGYNGNGGGSYATVNLSGSLPAQMGGYGTLGFAMAGLQNGAPDGLALVDGSGAVVQFLSYEGTFVATDGAATGLTSTDIGVSEASTAPVGTSLQLGGTGTTYADFAWQGSQADTPGAVNTGQTLGDGSVAPVADFSGTPVSGDTPLVVAFTDLSTGSPSNWTWDFGDGGTSTAQNPSHTYTTAGTYTVTLTAGNGSGSNSKTRTGYITVTDPPVGGWTVITYDDFESGMGSYRDGGKDMKRYSGSYSHQGSYSADIQDNSGTSSSFYHSSGHDVSGYSDLEVEFWYKPVSMDKPGEDFWVQYWDGSSWQTVAVFDKGTDFENGNFYNVVVQIPAATYNYPTDAKLRFMCDASGNADDVYIDEIEFRGFN